MSSPLKARPPAWSGLLPDYENYQPTEPSVRAGLCAALGICGKAREPAAGQTGNFYQFYPDSGRAPLFLKIVDQERLSQQLAGDRVAAWLGQRGVRTSRLLSSFPRPFDEERLLLGYRLIDGRPARIERDDREELGRSLADLHRQLQILPWRAEIRDASRQRDLEFRRARARLLDSGRLDPEVRTILRDHPTDLPDDRGQVIHGDLNLGNVLFEQSERHSVLLDFEDAVHNHHDISVDLAMAIERFVLVRYADDSSALAAAASLLAAYRRRADFAWPDMGLGALLRTLSTRALVLLHMNGTPVDPDERRKFIQLIRQTHERRDLLDRVQRL